MEYRNVSLEIERIREGLARWEETRKKTGRLRTKDEKEMYEFAGKVIRQLETDLKEALEYKETMPRY